MRYKLEPWEYLLVTNVAAATYHPHGRNPELLMHADALLIYLSEMYLTGDIDTDVQYNAAVMGFYGDGDRHRFHLHRRCESKPLSIFFHKQWGADVIAVEPPPCTDLTIKRAVQDYELNVKLFAGDLARDRALSVMPLFVKQYRKQEA